MAKTDHFKFSFTHDHTKKSQISERKTSNPEVWCIFKDREFAYKKTANNEVRLYSNFHIKRPHITRSTSAMIALNWHRKGVDLFHFSFLQPFYIL
jgi:hypothetical protein